MKKTILAIAMCMLFIGGALAQNSAIEVAQQETQVEKFLKNTTFVKEVELTSYSDNGLEIYGKVFTDLKTNKKTAVIQFYTESKVARQAFASIGASLIGASAAQAQQIADDGKPRPLGYLDLAEVNSLVSALEEIVAQTNQKSKLKYTIDYTAVGGINVLYDSEEGKAIFRKVWYSTNAFGVKERIVMASEGISIKSITKIIATLKDAKTKLEAEVK